jgi:RAT1-interacting protein
MIVAPYEARDGWSINVMHVDGVLYFEEHLTDAQLEAKYVSFCVCLFVLFQQALFPRNNLEPRLRQSTYYGYSFESWCTSSETPSPDRRPTWGGDVNTAVQWCGVAKTKLGDTRLVLGGEVDCVKGRFTGQTDTFVELKTSLAIRPRNAGDESRFER